MSLRSRLRGMSERSEREVLAAWGRRESGSISEDEFITAAANIISRQNRRAVALADMAMARQISRELRRSVSPLGDEGGSDSEDSEEQQDRLAGALRTVISASVSSIADDDMSESVARRLARVARSEPLARGQDMIQRALRTWGMGWTRATGPDPCEMCQGLADGTVLPADADMVRHTGCSCMQQAREMQS